jgi:hypothetical protein
MSQDSQNGSLKAKTDQLLKGSLKHVRAAALAAALVPLASIAVSKAVAQDCGSGGTCSSVPSPCDFMTSGGFIYKDSGDKATFGAHGGCKNGQFWGHVNYVDHQTGYHLDSIDITGYLTPFPGSKTREICGIATSNGAEPQPVYFRVSMTDNGEPGIADDFSIRTSNGYSVSQRLLAAGQGGGGNVQLHDPNPSTKAPNPVPNEFTMCHGVS